jgi:hypothetical protein
MGSSKSRVGAGPAGAEEQRRIGPGKAYGQPDTSNYPSNASSGKGIKPSNKTRGQEEDEG